MITGTHALIYTPQADAVRAFFRDVLGLSHVDAGQGWLIFTLPPAELGIHPEEDGGHGTHELYFMCDDVDATVRELTAKGVEFTRPITDQGWGRVTALRLPGGMELGIYEPRHPTALPDTDMA
ncbi:Glyoxalase-like domain protein (plasmid) [Gemmatirosa kalamazoonensis]|jgi:predicted enzyme related to lactoylglutathione lyase|uniref:Glyoxalase-like domain protein n=1 Tax=Gemmatirosa kalamazoonensis TaxID=861299 RepID=W0RPY9_9BACT|nr:VOC family protein [Gemmatirosa kalamazoonensis]AHG92761.1 Glyoxalase-like domain protein [Gemmatirosa kalamazoonensis]